MHDDYLRGVTARSRKRIEARRSFSISGSSHSCRYSATMSGWQKASIARLISSEVVRASTGSNSPASMPSRRMTSITVRITSVTDESTGGGCDESGGLVDSTGHVSTTNDGSDDSSAEICVAAPAIHILKTADAALVSVGDSVGFTMTVYNNGIGDAHGVTLNDVLPTNAGLAWSIDHTGG